MILSMPNTPEPILVFEARVVDDEGATLAVGRGSTPASARALALSSHTPVDRQTRTEVALVARFRVPVVDQRGWWMYMGYGLTADEARADAAFWILRRPATVH